MIRPTLGWKIEYLQWLGHHPHPGTSQWLVFITSYHYRNLAMWGLSCHDVARDVRREVFDQHTNESPAAFIKKMGRDITLAAGLDPIRHYHRLV